MILVVLKTFLSDFSKSSSWETQLMLTIVVHVDGGITSILHIMVVYSVFPPQHFINHFTMQMLMWSNKRNGQLLLRNSLFISFFPNYLHVIGKMHRPFLSPFPSGHHIFWCNLFLSSIRVPVFTFASCTHSKDHVIIALVSFSLRQTGLLYSLMRTRNVWEVSAEHIQLSATVFLNRILTLCAMERCLRWWPEVRKELQPTHSRLRTVLTPKPHPCHPPTPHTTFSAVRSSAGWHGALTLGDYLSFLLSSLSSHRALL